MGVKLLQSVLPSPSSDACATHAVSSVASRFHQANVQISAARVTNPRGNVRRPSGLAPTQDSVICLFSIKRGNKFQEKQLFFFSSFYHQHKLLLYLLSPTHQTRRLCALPPLQQCVFLISRQSVNSFAFIWTTLDLFIHSKPRPNPSQRLIPTP